MIENIKDRIDILEKIKQEHKTGKVKKTSEGEVLYAMIVKRSETMTDLKEKVSAV